jgi:hypothetical protein
MVKRDTLLRQAIAAHLRWASPRLVDYVEILDLIAASDQADPEWERVVARAKPTSPLQLAGQLLSLVVTAALEANMSVTPSFQRPEGVEARYAKLLEALAVLEREFNAQPYIRVTDMPAPQGRNSPTGAEGAGLKREDTVDAELLRAVIASKAVLEGAAPPNDPDTRAHYEYMHFRRIAAPEFLCKVREHLGHRKAAYLAVANAVPHTRKRGQGADFRAFIKLLNAELESLLGFEELEFIITLATIVYPDADKVYSIDAAKQLLLRAAAMTGPAGDG